jgi:hypothetical protein
VSLSVFAVAKEVRAQLLKRNVPRNLAGECGLAAMLIADRIGDPWALRTGCYMARDHMLSWGLRYPHRHAWCQIGSMILDVTATQFSGCHRAVHTTTDRSRYVEFASGPDAISDIMNVWCARKLPEYGKLARRLREKLRHAC